MRARSLNICLLRDGNGPALARLPESELAVALGEDRVVLADSGARTGAKARTALADDDHSCLHDLPVEQLDAEALRVRVAAVAGGAKTFLVSHYFFSGGFVLVAGFRAGALRTAGFFAAARGFAAALGFAAGFGFASAFGSSFFAELELACAPIDWISISESLARKPVCRR